ncbi:MAG: DUF2442 domain-containing protein [Rhodoferax sp.]|nr:DUF2442 domain-containing protein [Rhodoferax sp.]
MAKIQQSRLTPSPKVLQKALEQSARQAHRLADAFGVTVPSIKPKPARKSSLKGLGMNTSPKAVRFDDNALWVSLSDGRTIAAPLAWFPRLLEATPEQRAQVELSKNGLHWDALDEDISVAGLLAGQPDLSRRGTRQTA